MNNFKKLFFALSFILLLISCTEDEQVNDDCFTCETTQTEYCYTIGNTYYHTSNSNESFNTQFNGATWSDTKAFLEDQCNGISTNEDCYTCSSANTEYCYTEGNTFYTISINDTTPVEIPLNGILWEDLKTAFEENCDDNPITSSIVGNWKLVDYQMTTETTITINDENIVSSSIGYVTEYNSFMQFTETPNEFDRTGTSILQITFTDENGNETVIDDFELETLSGTWEINEDQLITLTEGDTEEETSTILELSNETLRLRLNDTKNEEDLDGNPKITVIEIFMTFERQ